MNRIRKGDQIVVIAGKDKGKKSEITRVGQAGGIVEREAPIHISNVMLFNPVTGKGDRVGFKVLEDGRKVRVFRSSGEAIDA